MLQQAASCLRVFRVERFAAFLNGLYHSFFVDDKSRSAGEPDERNQYTVFPGHGFLLVAQDRKFEPQFFRVGFVFGTSVHADTDHLRARGFEFGDITLIRLELPRSATGECLDVKSQHHIFLAAKIAELDRSAALIGEGEIRSRISHLQRNSAPRENHAAPCK